MTLNQLTRPCHTYTCVCGLFYQISAFMVLSMITSIAAIAAFFVWIVEADEVEQKYRRSGQVSDIDLRTYVVISPH